MRKALILVLVSCLLMVSMSPAFAAESDFIEAFVVVEEPEAGELDFGPDRADPVFDSHGVSLNSSFYVTFSAVIKSSRTIKVTSVELQKKNGTSFSYNSTLTAPSTSTYGMSFLASSQYSVPSAGTYRLKVVFDAGGHQITSYSGQVTIN